MYVEQLSTDAVLFLDLENPLDLVKLENPMLVLSKLSYQLIIIDEIQRKPDLFPVLRVLVDESNKRRFLILGSASRDLIRQSSDTLAGRIGYIELMPFSLEETPNAEKLWLRGGFPKAYLAEKDEESFLWRQSYISTFLERDIPNLGFQIPPEQIRRFWLMLVHCHGQIFNASEIGKSLGVSDHTVRKYLDILVGTFMIRLLSPWYENLGKRQVKSPKIYFRDSGILNTLIGIMKESDLHLHPKLGSFWEGFALESVIVHFKASAEESYFWKTHSGAELDLLIVKEGKKLGFECKYSEKIKITPSMQIALNDLKLNHLYVLYPGKTSFPLSENISAIDLFSLKKHISL
jgi:predicted AAA+ superfamily ATPase